MAFYDEMAELAQEMLAEFGEKATLTTKTSSYDKTTGRHTETVTSSRSTLAVVEEREIANTDGRLTNHTVATMLAKAEPGETFTLGDRSWTVGNVTEIQPTTRAIVYKAELT